MFYRTVILLHTLSCTLLFSPTLAVIQRRRRETRGKRLAVRPRQPRHTRSLPLPWGSAQSPRQGAPGSLGKAQLRPGLGQLRGILPAWLLRAPVEEEERPPSAPLRPAPAPAGPSPSVFCFVDTPGPFFSPPRLGSMEEIEPHRLAGVIGAATLGAKLKKTIRQRPWEEGSCISGSLQPLPNRPRLTSLLPPLLSAPDPGGVMTQGPRSVLQHHLSSGKEWGPGSPTFFLRQCLQYHWKSWGKVSCIHFQLLLIVRTLFGK